MEAIRNSLCLLLLLFCIIVIRGDGSGRVLPSAPSSTADTVVASTDGQIKLIERRREIYKVVKDVKGRYLLLHFDKKYYQIIPDTNTVTMLGFDLDLLHIVSDTILSKYTLNETPFPPIKENSNLLQIGIYKAIGLMNTESLFKERYSLPEKLNPVIVRWQGRWIASWRKGMYDSPINFAWVEFDANKRNEGVKFLLDDHHWGMGMDMVTTIKNFPFNNLQEDPRLLPLPNSSELIVQYTCKISLFKAPKQVYLTMLPPPSASSSSTTERAMMTIPDSEKLNLRRRILEEEEDKEEFMGMRILNDETIPAEKVTLTDSILLDGHPYPRGQKNWVMLYHNATLYFISTINPLRVLQHVETQEDRTGILNTVYNMESPIDLPWSIEYGSDIRGGTPAIYLTKYNIYLAFFHTVAQFLKPSNEERTYFMGAVTFCPQIPFYIHSMSPFPYVLNEYYQGPSTIPKRLNYVVFPVGLQEDDDKDHVWLSYGVRDKDGVFVKIEIEELLKTLTLVQECK